MVLRLRRSGKNSALSARHIVKMAAGISRRYDATPRPCHCKAHRRHTDRSHLLRRIVKRRVALATFNECLVAEPSKFTRKAGL